MEADLLFYTYILSFLSNLRTHWVFSIIGLVTIYLFHGYLKTNYILGAMDLPGPRVLPLFGTSWGSIKDKFQIFRTFDRYKKLYGDIYAMYFLSQPTIVVTDPEILRTMLVKEFASFHDRPTGALIFAEPLKSTMGILTGERWRKVRKIISPSFTTGKLKKVTGIMRKTSNTFISQLIKYADKDKTVDINGLLQNVTLDVILSAGFGLESACQTDINDKVALYAKEAANPNPLFPLLLQIPIIGQKLCTNLMPTKYGFGYGNLLSIAKKIVAQRRKQQDQNITDMLGMALEATRPDENGEQLTENEVLGQSLIFLLAGYDTSSITLGMICYHLAIDEDIQARLYEEMNDVIGDGEVEYERLQKLVYMEAVISEVLRLYPPGFMLTRNVNKDCEISGVKFRKDMAVLIPVYTIHRDERFWNEPEKFNPDRFLPENAVDIQPFSYLPFGSGPRNCIGMRFAQLEIKYVLIKLLQKYKIHKGEGLSVPIKIVSRNVLTIGEPVNVRLTTRE